MTEILTHKERYPEGCRSAGHRCNECTERLNDVPHKLVKIGARKGYSGYWVCSQIRCAYSQ